MFFYFVRLIKGVVTLGSLMSRLLSKKAEPKTPVDQVLYSQFKRVTLDTTLSKVSRILERDHYVIVFHNQRLCKSTFNIFIIVVATHRTFNAFKACFTTNNTMASFLSADSSGDSVEERTVVIGIVTQIDLLNYITTHVSTE